jgi:copper(I)-binding protein
VSLAPGGYHLMFMDLKAPLVEGESVTVTLTFEKAGTAEVQLPVGSPAAKGPAMDHSMHSSLVTTLPGDLA